MSGEEQRPAAEEGDPVLDELAVEVEADLELIAKSRVGTTGSETPAEWLVDPEEVQLEETELHSLQGAVEILEDDHHLGDASSH